MVSGILLFLSIIDFALAAPVLVQEKHQAHVDTMLIPKDSSDVMTVLGKRGLELDDLIKMGKLAESPEAHAASSSVPPGPDQASSSTAPPRPDHAPSSSAPPGPDYWSANVMQAPGTNPALSTADSGHLMDPLSTSLAKVAWWDDGWSHKVDAGFHSEEPMFTPTSSYYHGSDDELAADTNFDWEHWQKKVNEEDPPPQPHDNLETVPAAPGSDFDWEHWQKKVNEEDPPPVQPHYNPETPPVQSHYTPETASLASGSDFDWEHWEKKVNEENSQPAPIPAPPPPPNLRLTTNLESHPNLMAAHQSPPYSLSPTDHYGNSPSSPTEVYSYSYPGSVVPNTVLPTIPEHEMVAGPPSPDLEPLGEPENELHNEPPTTPEGNPSSITNSQPVDPQALTQSLNSMNYDLKGKAKVSGATRGL